MSVEKITPYVEHPIPIKITTEKEVGAPEAFSEARLGLELEDSSESGRFLDLVLFSSWVGIAKTTKGDKLHAGTSWISGLLAIVYGACPNCCIFFFTIHGPLMKAPGIKLYPSFGILHRLERMNPFESGDVSTGAEFVHQKHHQKAECGHQPFGADLRHVVGSGWVVQGH